MQKTLFSELGLSPEILKAVQALGFEEAAPIQAAAIPILMTGRDVVGQSQTGSGKTAAFAIPAIEKIDCADLATQALVLCPTRELATQVANEVHKLAQFLPRLHSVPIYGGASYDRQFYELKKGAQFVIGTPGRVIDHLDRGTLVLDALKVVILDEADRMLDMGFREDIERVLESVPSNRQTVFFSATVSKPIRELINRYSNNAEMIRIEQKEVDAPAIEQWFYEVHYRAKTDALIRLIDYHDFKLGIVFCNTQRMVDELADTLIAQGISADRLHGGIAQAQRTRVMNKFKKAEFEILVATDVAARGIDVDDLEVVVNYDLPYDAEDYVHRIGRTGRAGRRGISATFVTGRDIYKLRDIERFTRTKIQRGTIPTASEVDEKRADMLLTKVRATLDSGEWSAGMVMVDRLLEEGVAATQLAGALFHLLGGVTPESKSIEPPPRREFEDSRREPRPDFQDSRPRREPRDSQREERKGFRKDQEREPRGDFRENKELRPPATGKAWVSVNVGRGTGFGPREIVDALSEGTGLVGKAVGTIDLGDDTSFVQVPTSFARSLSRSGSQIDLGTSKITILPVDAPKQERGGFAGKKPFHKEAPFRKGGHKGGFRKKY